MTAASYWPWWLGAASLAVVTVGSCVVARRPLGVSGIVARFVHLRSELAAERQRKVMAANEAAIEAMLLAATAEAFGPAATGTDAAPGRLPVVAAGAAPLPVADAEAAPRKGCGSCQSATSRPTLGTHAVFLLAIVAGGLTVQLARGGWRPTLDMGPAFASIFGRGAGAAVALALGGVLVGVGTALSGGCSTGHGLSGCSRLQPASVAATGTFMASAVAVSFALAGTLR